MVFPTSPSPDTYDANEQIAAHFFPTPALTSIPPGHRYHKPAAELKHPVAALYAKHRLTRCSTHGLYFAGSARDLAFAERVRTIVLVFELTFADARDARWTAVDGELRRVLREWDLDGRHGVCLRYYTHLSSIPASTSASPTDYSVPTYFSTAVAAAAASAPASTQSTRLTTPPDPGIFSEGYSQLLHQLEGIDVGATEPTGADSGRDGDVDERGFDATARQNTAVLWRGGAAYRRHRPPRRSIRVEAGR